MTADRFATGPLRRAVLAGWSDHPPRFREDANAEEDNARRYYRDRVVVELAQNAADAAARAGGQGRLALHLARTAYGVTLTARNTGRPLDAAGVASLASLRASAKHDDTTVGRFGVGFAAVRSVADEVTVASRTGAVHFSLAATRAGLRDAPPGLSEEVARRGDALPVLRLPFPGPAAGHPGEPGEGWDTAVVLTLRDDVAVERVRAELAALGDVLLLALPALTCVEVRDEVGVPGGSARVLRDVGERWVVATRTGVHDAALLADAAVEDRDRRAWRVTWAVRRPGATAD
ncbi:sacsin N-terminal ATP-binding-like domain-containing protein, partial [Actinotalea sp. JY-7885]